MPDSRAKSAVIARDASARRVTMVGEDVWIIGSDRVAMHTASTGAVSHRLILPPASSPFTGAVCAVNDTVWLGHQNGAIRIVHRDGRGQLGPSFREHSSPIFDLCVCSHSGTVASSDVDGDIALWPTHGSIVIARFCTNVPRARLCQLPAGGFVAWWKHRIVVIATRDANLQHCAQEAVDRSDASRSQGYDICGALTVMSTSEIWMYDGSLISILSGGRELEFLAPLRLTDVIESMTECTPFVVACTNSRCLIVDAVTRSLHHELPTTRSYSELLSISKISSWRLIGVSNGDCVRFQIDAPSFDQSVGEAFASLPVPRRVEDVRNASKLSARHELVDTLNALRGALGEVSTFCEASVRGDRGAALAALMAADRAHRVIFDAATRTLTPEELDQWTR